MALQMEKIGPCTLYCGDCLEIMPQLGPGFQCILTDPPYCSGTGASLNTQTSKKYQNTNTVNILPNFLGDNKGQLAYLYWYSFLCSDLYRLGNDGAIFYSFIDWRNLATLATSVQIGNWDYRGIIPWVKPAHESRPVKGGFRLQVEYVVWGSKGKPLTCDKYMPGVLNFSTDKNRNRVHSTQKPIEMLKTLLDLPAPGKTLDPFLGSGSTGVACIETGREFVGIELSPECFDMACQRIENALKNQQNKLPIDENE